MGGETYSAVERSISASSLSGGVTVYAGGSFTDAGGVANADKIARWDGSNWHGVGSGLNDNVFAIAVEGATSTYLPIVIKNY